MSSAHSDGTQPIVLGQAVPALKSTHTILKSNVLELLIIYLGQCFGCWHLFKWESVVYNCMGAVENAQFIKNGRFVKVQSNYICSLFIFCLS